MKLNDLLSMDELKELDSDSYAYFHRWVGQELKAFHILKNKLKEKISQLYSLITVIY